MLSTVCKHVLSDRLQGEAGTSRAPRVTSPLDTVPFYRVLTVMPGESTELEVTAPDTLTTYVLRTVAASSDGESFGTGQSEFTIRKPLSLTPSVPRLLRAGDSGTVGVIVTFFGAATQTSDTVVPAAVTVEASGPLTLIDPSGSATSPVSTVTIPIEFNGVGSQQEVRVPVVANTVGEGTITFSASIGTTASDSLTVDLGTLVPQAPVVIATSFPVKASQGWKEGLRPPRAIAGMNVSMLSIFSLIYLTGKTYSLQNCSQFRTTTCFFGPTVIVFAWHNQQPYSGTGELSVSAGVGNLPAQIAMTRQLLEATPDSRYPTATWAVSILAMHAIISAYGEADSQPLSTVLALPQYAADRLGVEEEVSLCEALGSAVPFAVSALKEMSSIPRLGLMNYPPRAWPGWTTPSNPDVWLNLMVGSALIP